MAAQLGERRNCRQWMRGRKCHAFLAKEGCPGLHPRYVGPRGDLLDAIQCHRFGRQRCFDDDCRWGHFTVMGYHEMLEANGEAALIPPMPPMPPMPPQQPQQPWPQPPPQAWRPPPPGPQPGANFHEQPQPPGAVIVMVNGAPSPQPGAVTADGGRAGRREDPQPQVEPVPEGQALVEQTKLDLEGLEPGVRKQLAQAVLAKLAGLADTAEALPRLHLAVNNLQAYLATVAMS